ncbi:MAG TPA: DNA-3-methyladenine glycosylase 2 family protein [Candidatus Bathyarchaeia archaeon]|nr:DNA-3-methyladenine glycosylase 2 family protein [Candidatus Bathyarchaeia archaeon]
MFPSIGEPQTFRAGARHVSREDSKIRALVKKHGLIEFEVDGDPFESLVGSILSQQLNGAVAKSIFEKLKAISSDPISAESLNRISISKLRRIGVSPQKISYLKDLSARVVKGQLYLDDMKNKSDDEIIRILDEVKGIGPWTAHMFLLFTLGRTDVLPVGDLGIQMSIRKLYALRKDPDAEKIKKIAHNWHPYCSIASLYLWRAKD